MSDFDEFWRVYPRKADKGNARKAWAQTEKIRPDLQTLIDAVIAQSQTDQWYKDGGQYIPYPASWLRGERWDDCLKITLPEPERKPDRYDLANRELAEREAEFRARQALQKASREKV